MRVHIVGAVVALLLAVLLVPVTAHSADPHPLDLLHAENIVEKPLAGAKITIDATILKGMGAEVDVVWSGMPVEEEGHWIGVYAPRPKKLTKIVPSKYRLLGKAASGREKFFLLNQRAPVTVAYFTGGLKTPLLIAESKPVPFENYNIPMQPHLSLTANASEMRVTWVSALNNSAGPAVSWGRYPNGLTSTATAVSTTYDNTMMCGEPATRKGYHTPPGNIHTAVMTGLDFNSMYYYRLHDNAASSEPIPFWTAPKPGSDVDFFVFGDLGQAETDGSVDKNQTPGAALTNSGMQQDINSGRISLDRGAAVFHIGDIAYARGYASVWEQFFFGIQNISQTSPWMTTDGNHERDYPGSGSLYTGTDSGGECGVPYNHRLNFAMPHEHAEKIDETWWSVNYGPTHWIVISTEHAFAPGSAQHDFVLADLKKVDRKVTPFLVFAGHRPMYCQGMMGGVADSLRDAFEPLFVEHKVDVAFWGHHHSYQRTCAVHKDRCEDETKGSGTVHIVTGAAGAGLSTVDHNKTPEWIKYVDDTTHGYVRGRVRSGELTFDFVHNDKPDVVADSVTIKSKFDSNGKLLPQFQDKKHETIALE